MAEKIAFIFVQKGIAEKDRSEIYSYGLELLIATLLNGILVFATALIVGVVSQTVFLLLPFFLLRRLAGGFHAKTHIGCMTGFLTVYWVSLYVLKSLPTGSLVIVSAVMLTVSAAIILCIGAIVHENNPVEENDYITFKRKARITTSILFAVGMTGLYFCPVWAVWFSFGVSIAAGSLLAARINKK